MSRITPVAVPKWGIEMQEGNFIGWRVAEGSRVSRGEEIADMETEKIANVLEAPADGILKRCLAEEGETLAVGSLLGVIADEDVSDAEIDAFIAGYAPGESSDTATQAAPSPAAAQAKAEPVRVSVAAKKLAEKLGVDLSQVQGSGRRGRIVPEDVERAARGGATTPTGEYTASKLSATRQTIARRLLEAKRDIPHYYLSAELDAGGLLAERQRLADGGTRVSLTDLLVQATAKALLDVPALNAHRVGDEIRTFSKVHVAVAVETDKGLIAPVIRDADSLDIGALAERLRSLADAARNGRLTTADLEGATFTVSNLGMFDISQFTAIITPPQVGVLAVGAVRACPAIDSGQLVDRSRITVTLSCDHAAIDGAVGARFLQALAAHCQY